MSDMTYIECPDEWNGSYPSVFLAGGITNCPDWQRIAADWLIDHAIIPLNPRRANFPIDDPTASEFQIKWEFRHLHYANAVLFWFPASESPQPIAMYELGYHAAKGTPIAVGCSPLYSRKSDVYHQLRLIRPDVRTQSSLTNTLTEVERLVS